MIVKFALTLGATFLLLLHQYTAVAAAAERASIPSLGARPEMGEPGTQLIVDATLAIAVLLTTTTLSIYKPWGRTRYWRRKLKRERQASKEVANV